MRITFAGQTNLSQPSFGKVGVKPPTKRPLQLVPRTLSKDTVQFGNTNFDEDTTDFWDLVKKKQPPGHIIDNIINGRVNINPDGSLSYPITRVDRPHLHHGGNAPLDPGAPGNGGDDGEEDGSGGPGKPGKGRKGKPGPGQGGVGSGGGNRPGDKVGDGEGDDGEGGQQAGEGAGSYDKELWTPPIPPSEIAQMMGKNFGLPFLEPKGKGRVTENIEVHNTLRKTPPGTWHIQKTQENIIKRAAALAELEGRELNIEKDIDDKRLLVDPAADIVRIGSTIKKKPYTRAVIFYLMDVSGSVSDEMKQKARTNNILLSTWLKYQYGLIAAKSQHVAYDDEKHFGKGVEERFIIHTSDAKEVPEKEFYTTVQSGGTAISAGYKKIKDIVDEEYPPEDWNVYIFQYSDGDSFGDNEQSGDIIKGLLDRGANLVGYCDLAPNFGWWGFNNFKSFLKDRFANNQHVRICDLPNNDIETYRTAIQTLLADEKKGVIA